MTTSSRHGKDYSNFVPIILNHSEKSCNDSLRLFSFGILAVSVPLVGSFAESALNYLQIAAWQTTDFRFAYHLTLHLLTLTLGCFLFAISVKAFIRDGRSRLALLSTAFALIAIREALNTFDLVLFSGQRIVPFTDIEVSHLIDFLIIALFSAGTLKS